MPSNTVYGNAGRSSTEDEQPKAFEQGESSGNSSECQDENLSGKAGYSVLQGVYPQYLPTWTTKELRVTDFQSNPSWVARPTALDADGNPTG